MAFLKEGLDTKDGVFVGNQVGDAPQAIAGAAKKLEAVYYSPLQNHVCMEPMNCTAKVTADKCEVWVATQNGEASLAAAAGGSGLPLAKCEVYKLHLGGGFGRRGVQDYVTQAVRIAKQIPGTPVKLVWSREEDMRQGRFKPVGMCKMTAGLDDKGDLVGLPCASRRSRSWPVRARTSRERQGLPSSSRASTRRGPKASSATPSPTSWSSTPCATRTCRRASGAASTTTRTRSGSSASSTSWPRRPARTRSSSAAS